MDKRLAVVGIACAIVALLLLAPSAGWAAVSSADTPEPQPKLIPGKIVIEFESDVTIQQVQRGFGSVSVGLASVDMLLQKHGAADAAKVFPWREVNLATNAREARLARYYEITVPEDADLDVVREDLAQNPYIRTAHILYAMPVAQTPDDPEFTNQWHREELQLESAWELETGSDNVVIAIIDTGVNWEHPDLQDAMWVNPGEDIDGDGVVYDTDDLNGIDDDGNGVVDDLIGWDFFSGGFTVMPGEDGFSPDSDPNDFDGHGTHCAGISAAITNNTTDVVGVAGGWAGGHRSYRGPRIMALRVGALANDGNGYVNPTNVAQAIDYATVNGADIINMSFGGSSIQTSAIANAITNGLTLVHAAGNDDCDCPDPLDGFGTGVLSVASTNSVDLKSDFSNYGAWVDVSGPGSAIVSTYSTEYTPGTETLWGTSMAAPMVCGVAALIRSAMPSLTKAEVDSIIMATADDIDALNPTYAGLLGTGRVNALNALSGLAIARFSSDVTDGDVPLQVTFTDESPNNPTDWSWVFGDGGNSTDQNPVYTYTTPGVYDVTLTVTDDNGVGEEKLNRYVWARADSLIADSIEAIPGTSTPVPVTLSNSVKVSRIEYTFVIDNDEGVTLDSVSTAGTRGEDFYNAQLTGFDPARDRYSVTLEVSDPGRTDWLEPGTGPVMNLYFNIPSGFTGDPMIQIDTTSWGSRNNVITGLLGEYTATIPKPGYLYSASCCVGNTGNVNDDAGGNVDLPDVIYLVNSLFLGGPQPPCPAAANVNGDPGCNVDLPDVIYLVNALFLGGPAPAPCNPACN
ncbi:S8 family serine peptidase [candidate division GN15 bacterium]|nr:S8 family serine peptidase [candidate division GN15 bacterium]